MIFTDSGALSPDHSLTFFLENKKLMKGRINKVICNRGGPQERYNTRLYTDSGDEMQLSGMTCGKNHRSTKALIELIKILRDDWGKGMTDEQIKKVCYENNRVELGYTPS